MTARDQKVPITSSGVDGSTTARASLFSAHLIGRQYRRCYRKFPSRGRVYPTTWGNLLDAWRRDVSALGSRCALLASSHYEFEYDFRS